MKNPHIGSHLDDFLAEESILEASTAVAVKRVIAWQVAETKKPRTNRMAVLGTGVVDEISVSLKPPTFLP